MNKRIIAWIAVVLLVLIVCGTGLAQTLAPQDISWNGTMTLVLDKKEFLPGEEISGKVVLYNNEEAALLGNSVVLHLSQGPYEYPSQETDNGNVVLEEKIDAGWLEPKSSKEITFNLPAQEAGEYRLDAYSWAGKSKLVGASNILYNPISEQLTVTGEHKEKPFISRALTNFNGQNGPVGFPIGAGNTMIGRIVIVNNSSTEQNGLALGLKICEWSVQFCDTNNEQMLLVNAIPAGKTQEVMAQLTAPQDPSAYEITMTLYQNSKSISVYKNRVIVAGATAKTRKLLLGGFNTESYNLTAVIAGSPDHFNYPVLEKFNAKLEIYLQGGLIEKEEQQFGQLATGDIKSATFTIREKEFDRICFETNTLEAQEEKTLDRQCYDAPVKEIQSAYYTIHPKSINVSWKYYAQTKTLTIKLQKELLVGRIQLYNADTQLFSENFEAAGEYTKEYSVEKDNYLLLVDDYEAKEQQAIQIVLKPQGSSLIEDTATQTLQKCGGMVCKEGLVCTTQTINTLDGACCNTQCVSAGKIESESEQTVPLLIAAAVIIAIIALFFIGKAVKAVRK